MIGLGSAQKSASQVSSSWRSRFRRLLTKAAPLPSLKLSDSCRIDVYIPPLLLRPPPTLESEAKDSRRRPRRREDCACVELLEPVWTAGHPLGQHLCSPCGNCFETC